MGHNVIVAEFTPFAGTVYEYVVPELPPDPETFRIGSPARRGLVPMDGPALFGFEVLTEGEAMAELLASRAVDWEAKEAARRDRLLISVSADVEEVVPVRSRTPMECPDCGRNDGSHHGDCPEAPF